MNRWMLGTLMALLVGLIPVTALATNVITAFGPALLPNAAGPNMFGSAQMQVSIYQTMPLGGIIDFALTNTSPHILLQPGKYANAFIPEIMFDLPDDYVPIYDQCQVLAPVGVRFSNGPGNQVVTTTIMRALDWVYETGHGGGLYVHANESTDVKNYNAVFSANALNTSGVPVDDYAQGWLKNNWRGGVFDTVIFRVKFENSGPITEGDLPFFSDDHLTVKFQGGDGSVFAPNHAMAIVPEPASLLLLVPAALLFVPAIHRLRRAH